MNSTSNLLKRAFLLTALIGFFSVSPASIAYAKSASILIQQESFEFAAKKATPAVVTVHSRTIVEMPQSRSWRDFFENRDRPQRNRSERQEQRSSGSGVVISEDGYIVTNNHVIEGVNDITITLSDKREYSADVVGVDPLTDIALLKIDAKNLQSLEFGNSDKLNLGQYVLAVGNPLGIGLSVTKGIVSALKRNMGINQDQYGIESFIQTDAVINRGNSGGALVDLKGNIVGINTAIFSGTGYHAGYGFAVPAKIVTHVVAELKKEGEVKRGYIGISLQEVNYLMAKANNWNAPKGVYVARVMADMPAYEAGLQNDDIVLEVDGVPVNAPNELQVEVSLKRPNTPVKLKLYRDGKTLTKTLRLKARDSFTAVNMEVNKKPSLESLGIDGHSLSTRAKRELDLESGFEIEDVTQFSSAARAGLRKGDIILRIGKTNVKTLTDLENYIENLDSDDVAKLYVLPRDGGYKRFYYVRIP